MSVFSFAGHTLDLGQGRLRNAAGDVMLRPKSLALLTYLLRNPGRVVPRDELIGAIWPDVIVSDDSVSQCLKDIRAALGPGAEGLIRTVPRRGFVLDEARLETLDGVPAADPSPTLASLAVLPFETVTGHEWLADGLAEDITTALARSRRLKVVSKSYSFAYRSPERRGDEIARALHVSHLLEGSVRLSGDRTRVSVRLLVGATGELLWAERFDRLLSDIFALQDEITEAVVRHLELELLPEERRAIRQARTTSIEAYDYELRGRQLAVVLTRNYLVPARRLFAKAAELDPGYARAHAGIAICDCYLRDWHSQDAAPDAILAIAERAIALDPSLCDAHAARGFALFCAERYEEARQAFRTALAIDPNSYEANLFFAMSLARFGADRDEILDAFRLTTRLGPGDYVSPMMVSSFLDQDDPERLDWARTALDRATRAADLHPENAAPLHRGAVALAHLGERDRAFAWLARALVIDPDDFVAHVNAGCVHALLGNPDTALDHLEIAVRHVPQNTIDMLRNDPDFAGLRAHPRFDQVLPPRPASR
ncbi:MAG: TPR end-of-group domain-containing protein [Devosia sp.]